jgi:uncharacterized membrane protein YgdD (TMEM256/DUF423 family)
MKKHLITFFQLTPVIINMLLIAAHFMRANNSFLVIVCVALLTGLFVRAPLAARMMQGALVIAAIEWGRTIHALVSLRLEIGLPWVRLAVILGAVACFTMASGLVFFSGTLKERYRLDKRRITDK